LPPFEICGKKLCYLFKIFFYYMCVMTSDICMLVCVNYSRIYWMMFCKLHYGGIQVSFLCVCVWFSTTQEYIRRCFAKFVMVLVLNISRFGWDIVLYLLFCLLPIRYGEIVSHIVCSKKWLIFEISADKSPDISPDMK